MPAQFKRVTITVPVRQLDWLIAKADLRGVSVETLLSEITTAALIAVRRATNH